MERLKCVNQQLSKENNVSRNICVNSTNRIVQEICSANCCKISNSHDLSNDNLNKTLKPEERVPAYQCDKPSGYVFVDVGSDLIGSGYLLEEDDDIYKVSSETLFTDSRDIDYNLVKKVNIEICLNNSSKENEMNNHNLETTVFNINDSCTGNDRSGLSTNACMENVCENLNNYDKKPSIGIDYTTASTVVSASSGFEKVNIYVKEEKSLEDVLVHQCTENMSPEIKKEEMVYDEEVSILNECIIDTKLLPVNKVEEPPDISTNYSCVLDENSKTGFIVLSKTVNSGFQEVYTECSKEVSDSSDIGDVIVLKPLKENETVQSKREFHLKLQNKVQTLSRTCSELQIKRKSNSGDDTGADGVEECQNKLSEEDVNTEAKNKNGAICQYHRKRKSEHTTDRHYVCKVCYKAFTQLCDLKDHKCTHTADRPFGCDTCGKAFTQLAHLEDHKRIHTGERPFGCNTCGKAFTQLAHLKGHKRIHSGDRPFGCSTCGKAFTHLSHLKGHNRIHTGDKPFGCDICGRSFTLHSNLKKHKHIHTGDRPFICSVCGKAFRNNYTLKAHERLHTGDRPYGCSTCGKAFTLLTTLKNHKRIHTGDRPKRLHTVVRPFGCDTCGKAFKDSCVLKAHERIHTGDRPFYCSTCDKAFTQLAHLKVHKCIHSGDRPFGCDTCGKAFKDSSALKGHKRIHSGDRPYVCSTCGKAFTGLALLKDHKHIHTGDRTFGCDTCGKAFTQLSHLKRHIHIHSGDKHFGCSTCGKAFTRLAHLKTHKCIHTGEKPFVCSTCGKGFTQSSSLKKHKQVHSKEEPLDC